MVGAHIFELGHRDGRFIRAGGVYVLTRRRADGGMEALYVGEAEVIAAVVGPGHPVWRRALQLGLSGLLVVLEKDPVRRRRFAVEMEATLQPVLNGRDEVISSQAVISSPDWMALPGAGKAAQARTAPSLH
jgi:hypothetical protein